MLTREPEDWQEISKSLQSICQEVNHESRIFQPYQARAVTAGLKSIVGSVHAIFRKTWAEERQNRRNETENNEGEDPESFGRSERINEARQNNR